MTIPGAGRPLATLAILAAMGMGIGSGCAAPASDATDLAGGTSATDVSHSTVTPESPTGSASAAEGTQAPVADGVFGRITSVGNPVAGAMVQPAPGPGNPAPEREVFAVSAADGSYGIGLSPGPWILTIAAGGYQPLVLDVLVPAQGAVQVDAVLDAAG